MKERKLSLESNSFESLVDEIVAAKKDLRETNTERESAECNYNMFFMKEVKVCEIPRDMVQMSFPQSMTYDLTHFLCAQEQEENKPGGGVHGHNLIEYNLKCLTDILRSSSIIETVSKWTC